MGIIETERLYLREFTKNDFDEVVKYLQDIETMYAYEKVYSDDDINGMLDTHINRYKNDGYSIWAVILKDSGRLIGQCGITLQSLDGKVINEIGYIFNKDYWYKGYASEAAIACREYAFNILDLSEVYSLIRVNNYPSQRVAERNGMSIIGEVNKFYNNKDMEHYIYMVSRG